MDQLSGVGLHAERKQRIADNVALHETDRVPFTLLAHFWPAKLAGITYQEAMYDMDKLEDATRQALRLVEPDGYAAMQLMTGVGPTLEAMDYRQLTWPGHGTDANSCFQYLDQEYMTADEYDDYLFDPTGFFMYKYLPRVAGVFKTFEYFPLLSAGAAWKIIGSVASFANPELIKGFEQLVESGKEMATVITRTVAFINEMKEEGYPIIAGGRCQAPFDIFADYMRGSKGAMLDMYRCPDKLLAAMEKSIVLQMADVGDAPKALDCPYISINLHWGLDGFMSEDQFNTFYWPQLRNVILQLIEMDLVPVVFWEGNCTSRLETIADIPPGKAIYWFEKTDLKTAKDVLGGIVCLRGNVPPSLLNTANADDVDEYCKNLIKTVGKGGGFILDGGACTPDEARVENVVAMAQSVKKYIN